VVSAAESGVYQLKHFKYSSHYWILKFIAEARRPLRILDVGTADGYLGSILRKEGHYVVGIERDELMARQARFCYHDFHFVDIETFEFPFPEQFDVVLFADVLEHLRDPATVLGRVLPCLKRSGEIIISVPNIANFIIRVGLVLGRFNYTDRGILDRTHLRFFTLSSAKRMLDDCGCKTNALVVSPVPVQLVIPLTRKPLFAWFHECHYAVTSWWKAMFAYQFVIRATCRQQGMHQRDCMAGN
jgi:SAM-dependent methyltransferase